MRYGRPPNPGKEDNTNSTSVRDTRKEIGMRPQVFVGCFIALALVIWMNGPAWAADMHQGKVVETGGGKIIMTDMAGKNQHTHDVATDAAVTCEGKTCGLSDVKSGDMVTVTTDTKDGKTMATKIEAKKAGS
jgi:hypothetical protein